MRHVEIYRADGVLAEEGVDEVTMGIRQPIPVMESMDRARAFYASEGAALAEAIWASCPGGTVDALIAALLARRASLFRVPFDEVTP